MTGSTSHDPGRFGSLSLMDGRHLVRVADVVRHIIERDRLPLRPAAAQVLDALASTPTLALFRLHPADFAEPVSDATSWRPAAPARPARFERSTHEPHSFRWQPPRLLQAAAPADPGVVGRAAGLAWVRAQWVQAATGLQQLDEHRAGSLAMLATDAAAVFGLGEAAPGLVVPPAPRRVGDCVPLPDPEQLKAELDELKASGARETTGALARKYGCDAETIRRNLPNARTKKAKKQKPASPFDVLTRTVRAG